MKKMKNYWKIFLLEILLVCVWNIGVQAEDFGESFEVELPSQLETQRIFGEGVEVFTEGEDELPVLKDGNYEKWIDRVDLPWYGKYMYTVMEEATDNDGVNDFLIDRYNRLQYVKSITLQEEVAPGEYEEVQVLAIKLVDIWVGAPGEDAVVEAFSADFEEKLKHIVIGYQAFRRDHPEVFWLNDSLYFAAADFTTSFTENYDRPDIWSLGGSVYMVLEYDNISFDMVSEKYQNEFFLRKTMKELDVQINTIIEEAPGNDAVSKVEYFNEWLTMNNEHNTNIASEEAVEKMRKDYPEVFECVAALKGNTGEYGPTVTSYAHAFKVLCDRAGIPCTLVNGTAGNIDSAVEHMWNYVEVEGKWYAVDVAWNDPSGDVAGAVSGNESKEYLLLGENTETTVGSEEMRFIDSHQVTNVVHKGDIGFTNGPVLCSERYISTIDSITLTASSDKVIHGYTEYPVISAEVVKAENAIGEPEYTWYEIDEYGRVVLLEGENSSSIILSEKTYGGIYTVRVEVTVGNCTKSKDIDIEVVLFYDIYEDDFYYDAVHWALANGITTGSSNRMFGTHEACTRGQAVTFLWRVKGCPEPQIAENPFKDISESEYYYKPVLWALENGITTGYTSDSFVPDDELTRAQFVTFLWRAEGKPEYEQSIEDGTSKRIFKDVPAEEYYYDAVYWALENAIVAGYSYERFAPDEFCVRAQVVTMLHRAYK